MFLEEQFPLCARMGASWGDEFNVQIVTTSAGQEHRRLVHPFPVRHFTVQFTQDFETLWSDLLGLYHRAFGMLAGFRVKCLDDYTTNNNTEAPTSTDVKLKRLHAGVYQLRKLYGNGASPLPIGQPERTIFKPVAGSVVASVNGLPAPAFTVDATTGVLTFTGEKTRAITGISKAASAVVTVGTHAFVNGDVVHFQGIGGMVEMNHRYGTITSFDSTTITVNINSASFTTYTSGGTAKILPQTADVVRAGCEFDIPCRFNSRLDYSHVSLELRETSTIDLIEILTP
jgi:uncharacterized protein (TIGR02217 family)